MRATQNETSRTEHTARLLQRIEDITKTECFSSGSAEMLSRRVKIAMKRTLLFKVFDDLRTEVRYRLWVNSGKAAPPPHLAKQMVIKEYAKRFRTRVFIETGTYLGEMVQAVSSDFRSIYSIELSEELCQKAQMRFASRDHIQIICGDSSEVLPQLLARIQEPCLFWLDGHYSGGNTAHGNEQTPILDELRDITLHPIDGHVILIDDARLFTGENGWPIAGELQKVVQSRRPDWDFEVKDDIIRAHGPAASGAPPRT